MILARPLLAIAVLALPIAAQAEGAPIEPKCKELANGGQRCRNSDGHVVTNVPDQLGRLTTTSTNPRDWGRRNASGRVITPDPAVKDSYQAIEYRRQAEGRVTEPWAPLPRPQAEPPGVKISHPDGSTTRCGPVGGTMRCR